MIYTKIDRLERYLGICDSLDIAIRHVMTADLQALNRGRNEVSGNEMFINRLSYETIPEESAAWEGHGVYGDLHVLIEGHEKIGVTDASQLKQICHKVEDDFIGYEGPVQTWCPMDKGDVLIVFPEDIHMVKVTNGEPCHVERAVYKFKVN